MPVGAYLIGNAWHKFCICSRFHDRGPPFRAWRSIRNAFFLTLCASCRTRFSESWEFCKKKTKVVFIVQQLFHLHAHVPYLPMTASERTAVTPWHHPLDEPRATQTTTLWSRLPQCIALAIACDASKIEVVQNPA